MPHKGFIQEEISVFSVHECDECENEFRVSPPISFFEENFCHICFLCEPLYIPEGEETQEEE